MFSVRTELVKWILSKDLKQRESHIYHPINQFRLMRRFYENWPDLKNLIPKLNLQHDDDLKFKLLQVMNSIELNAIGKYEMISLVLR